MTSIEFSGFRFDVSAERLTQNGEDIWLRPKTLKLLAFMLGHPGRVIGKDELMAALWPGRIVSDDSLTQCMKDLRKALGAGADAVIRTVHGRGYAVDERALARCGKEETTSTSPNRHGPKMETIIAVSATRDLSPEGTFHWLAMGITGDIVTALSRIPQLTVIHPAPQLELDSELKTWAATGAVDFVLRTSLRVAGKRMRLTVQIVNARTVEQIWSEQFDGALENVFEAQDEIVRKIAVTTQTELTYGTLAQLWEGGTKSLAAWAQMCAGRVLYLRFNAPDIGLAKTRLSRALELDPAYTGAMIQLGLCHYWEARFNTDLDRNVCLSYAEAMARTAFAITPDLPTGHMLKGGIAFLRDRHDEALAACQVAVGLSPSDSWAVAYWGLVNVYAGKPGDALKLVERARRLSPRQPGWYTYVETLATLASGDTERAEAVAFLNLAQEPDDTASYVNLAIALALQGKQSQAESVVRNLRLQFPAYSMVGFMRSERYRDTAYRDRLAALLRMAGLPNAPTETKISD